MSLNLEFAKKHWMALTGGLVGFMVLVYLLTRHAPKDAATGGSTLAGSSNQVQALNTAADITNAGVNGQVTMSAYAAGVAGQQTAAALQAKEVEVAAQLAATQSGQQVDLAKTVDTNKTAVQLQMITSSAAVAQTEIQGATLSDLAHTNANAQVAIRNTQLQVVSKQVGTLMQFSKHFNSDLTAITPLLTAELGNTQASVAASQTKSNADNANAQKVGSIVSGVTSVTNSLIGGLLG